MRTSYISHSRAKMYGFNLNQWHKNVLEGIDADYESIARRARKLASLFKGTSTLQIKASNGTDLKVKLSKLPAHIYSGLMTKPLPYNDFSFITNIPSGGIGFVPDPDSASGIVRFNRPVLQLGKRLDGLEWIFANGRLSKYSAAKNLNLFSKQYESEKGDKDRLGLIVIGLNPKLSYGFNYDLNVDGALTLGLGSFDEGDKNRTNFEFTATLSGATLKADGREIIRNGKMLV